MVRPSKLRRRNVVEADDRDVARDCQPRVARGLHSADRRACRWRRTRRVGRSRPIGQAASCMRGRHAGRRSRCLSITKSSAQAWRLAASSRSPRRAHAAGPNSAHDHGDVAMAAADQQPGHRRAPPSMLSMNTLSISEGGRAALGRAAPPAASCARNAGEIGRPQSERARRPPRRPALLQPVERTLLALERAVGVVDQHGVVGEPPPSAGRAPAPDRTGW